MPLKTLKQVEGKINIQPTTIVLRGFGGNRINAIGKCVIGCAYGDVSSLIRFVVLDIDIIPILGLNTVMHFGLIGREQNCHKNIAIPQKI